jgi:hypothetical protein
MKRSNIYLAVSILFLILVVALPVSGVSQMEIGCNYHDPDRPSYELRMLSPYVARNLNPPSLPLLTGCFTPVRIIPLEFLLMTGVFGWVYYKDRRINAK